MSLKLTPIQPVPDETNRVARAAFPTGDPYLTLRDRLRTIFADGTLPTCSLAAANRVNPHGVWRW